MTVAEVSKAPPASRAGAPRAPGPRIETAGAGGVRSHEKRWQQDRWETIVAPVGRFSGAMGLILLLSLTVHILIVGSALLSSPADVVAPQQETPVEIVQEAPKAEASKGEASKPPAPAAPAPVKSAAADTPSELRKGEPEQPDGKPEPQAAPTKPPPAQPRSPRAAARQPPEPPKADAPDEKLAALKSELEELKAQREALEAERAEAQAAQSQAARSQAARSQAAPSRMTQSRGGTAAPVETGLGRLPESFQAVALPMSGDGADEAVSYQQIVFSQLAKAKGIGGRQGLPGSAGVRFAIDEGGHLVSVEVVVASGIATLDAEALTIVRKAAPFPPPPPGAQRSFVANVNFTPLPAPLPSR